MIYQHTLNKLQLLNRRKMGTQNMIIATDRLSPEIKRGDIYGEWGD